MGYKVAIEGEADSFREVLLKEFLRADVNEAEKDEDVDILVFCINPPSCDEFDYDALLKAYDNTALELLRKTAKYLPRLDRGTKKRLCFITAIESSINNTRTSDHWERIISAACNMAVKTLFNKLSPSGYTFRVYGVMDFKDLTEASYAVSYILQDRSLEEESWQHSDEKRIVIRDKQEREYPW